MADRLFWTHCLAEYVACVGPGRRNPFLPPGFELSARFRRRLGEARAMIGVLLAMLLLIVVGLPLAMALPAAPRRVDGLLGEAWLLGSSAAGFVLLLLSMAGIAWSRTTLLAALAVIAAGAHSPCAVADRRSFCLPKRWANLIDLFTLSHRRAPGWRWRCRSTPTTSSSGA
jgi:hypothetical protein